MEPSKTKLKQSPIIFNTKIKIILYTEQLN